MLRSTSAGLRHSARSATHGVALLTLLILSGCGAKLDSGADKNDAVVGSASFALRLAEGVEVEQLSYTLTRPGGYRSSGLIPLLAENNTFGAVLLLPVARGYDLAVAATTAAGALCTGSAAFDVVADRTTPVNLALRCPSAGHFGTTNADGVLNVCPAVQSVVVQPVEDADGEVFMLSGIGNDADHGPMALSYAWRVSSGALTDVNAATTSLRCTGPGTVIATVSVFDGDYGCDAPSVDVNVPCRGAAPNGTGGTQAPAGGGGTSATEDDAGAVSDDTDAGVDGDRR